MAQKQDTESPENTECIVFVDHSNLWIAGKTEKGKALKDADSDPRYRVNLGRFLKVIVKGRSLSQAYLYGSRPPPNDHVWKAARKRNFNVNIFDRSCQGKEKEVDVAMATEITRHASRIQYDTSLYRKIVFIVVTGDRDLTTPVKGALEASDKISVELWSWESSMAREFRILANDHERFTVSKLDKIETGFSYIEYRSSRKADDFDPSKTLVFPNVSPTKSFYYSLANDLCCLLRIFHIGRAYSSGKLDLIVEFPNSTAEEVFKELRRCRIHEKPISYPEYMSSQREQSKPSIKVINRFEALESLEENDEDVIAEAMNLETDDIPTEPEGAAKEQGDTWSSVVRRKPGGKTIARRRRQTPCKWGVHCVKAQNCKSFHTDTEKSIFHENPKTNFKFWKTERCNKPKPHRQEPCRFAHTDSDSWCLKCKTYGHLTDACKG